MAIVSEDGHGKVRARVCWSVVANIRYVSFSKVSTNLASRDVRHRSRFVGLIGLRLGDAAVPGQHQGRSQTQKPARKKLIRRADRDHSQPLRSAIQILFATLTYGSACSSIFGFDGQKTVG